LSVEQEVCSDTLTADCVVLGCQQRVIRCQLPSLGSGDYAVIVPGGASRVLRVADGGVSDCRFSIDAGVP